MPKKTPQPTSEAVDENDWATWTEAQWQAEYDRIDEECLNYTPTAEELARGERFMRKCESTHVGPAQPPVRPRE